jgi:hypothetical protein
MKTCDQATAVDQWASGPPGPGEGDLRRRGSIFCQLPYECSCRGKVALRYSLSEQSAKEGSKRRSRAEADGHIDFILHRPSVTLKNECTPRKQVAILGYDMHV